MKKTHRSNLAAGVRRQAIVILGMHRSGTSALGGVLNILGASAPKTLMPPTAANPRGYWESTRLMAAHDALLQAAGSSWDDWRRIDLERIDPDLLKQHREEIKKIISEEFKDSLLFFLKDPRACRFFPLTLDILNEMNIRTVVYHIIRNPLEVAHSLKQRDGLSLPKSLLLWLRHTLEAEYRSRNLPRYFIPYEEFLTGWQKYLDLAAVETGIRFPMASEKSAADIERFLTSTLRHERFTFEEMQARPAFASWASEIYRIICSISERGEQKSLLHQLDLLRAKFEEGCAVFGESLIENEAEVRDLSADIAKQSAEMALLQDRTYQLEVTNQQSRTEVGLLQAQVQQLEKERSDNIRQLTIARQELMAANERITELQSSLQTVLKQFRNISVFQIFKISKESIKLRALLRHPFNSKKRKQYRESRTNAVGDRLATKQ